MAEQRLEEADVLQERQDLRMEEAPVVAGQLEVRKRREQLPLFLLLSISRRCRAAKNNCATSESGGHGNNGNANTKHTQED
jgi:hypothetical protein